MFALLFFKPVVAGDGFGYYAILEGGVRDGTLNLSQQLRFNAVANGTEVMLWPATGTYFSQYAPGLALVSAPLYAVSLVLDDFRVFHVADAFFLQERGDILVHMAAVAVTSLAFAAAAVLLSLFLLRKIGLQKQAAAAVLLAFFGSPLIRYATYDLTYSHAVEAGLLAAAVYLFIVDDRKSFWAGALLGVMTLVRYSSVVFALPFAAYYLCRGKGGDAGKLVLGMLPFIAALALYWIALFGFPLISSYEASHIVQGTGSFLGLPSVSSLVAVLFSLSRDPPGLLWWTPLCIAALYGVWLWRNEKKWVLLSLFALLLLVTASSFNGTTGFSFSHRYFAALFIIYALGCGVLLKEFGRKARLALGAMACWTVLLFVLHLAGGFSGFPTLNSLWEFWVAQGNFGRLPQLVFEKLGLVRLLLQR